MIHAVFILSAFFFSPVEELRAGLVGKLLLVVIGRFCRKEIFAALRGGFHLLRRRNISFR
jgi:hypothetical protein